MSFVYPRQKLTKAEKDEAWYIENVDYFVDQFHYYNEDTAQMILYYKAALGELDKEAYKYVLNPYNSTSENIKNFPAQLRNYDILTPILNLFLGEKAEKPFASQVVVTNPDAPNLQKEALNNAFLGVLAQSFINSLNATGVETGVDSKEVPPYEQFVKEFPNSYDDNRAMFGQEALDCIRYDLDLKDKHQEAFYDWLVVGRVYTYKDVYKGNLIYEIVPPLELKHGKSKTGFIEDSGWVVRTRRYTMNDIIDRFHEVLTDEEINTIEALFGNEIGTEATFINITTNIDTSIRDTPIINSASVEGLLDVYHVVFKTFTKVGILKFQNELGQLEEVEVDDTYKLNKKAGDISIDWEWRNEMLEGYRIGESIYKYLRPCVVQRDEISNRSICKAPYNGRIGYSERNKISSIVSYIIPYQALYNIYHFRAELTLARNKDKLMLMPVGLLPDGWETDKFLYFAETTGMLFFDETKPNAAAVLNAIRGIDMGLGNYVQQMRSLLNEIKQEAWEAVGMNRQRYGDTAASEGKGVVEQATFRSAIISREMFRRFERFEESDLQGLLDYSKVAWINGKRGMYIDSEGRRAFLQANPEQHVEADYCVYVKDSIEENNKLERSKQYAFGWAQKTGTKPSTVLEILDSTNMSKLKNFVKRAEQLEEELLMNQQQADRDNALRVQESINKDKSEERAVKIETANISADASRDVALINADASLAGGSGDEVPDVADLETKYNEHLKDVYKRNSDNNKMALESSKVVANNRLKEADLELKREQIRSAERIAKQNKNKYDK